MVSNIKVVSSCLAHLGMNDVLIVQGNWFTTEYVNMAVKRRTKVSIRNSGLKSLIRINLKDEWN